MMYIVDLNWDEEAGVWVATSEDVHGLVLESGSLDVLMEKVKYAVPELLCFNTEKQKQAPRIKFRAVREVEAYL